MSSRRAAGLIGGDWFIDVVQREDDALKRIGRVATRAGARTGLVKPGTFYLDRFNQLDLRLSKVLRFGARRASVNLDIADALNVSSVFVRSQEYGNWLQPQDILPARFVKIGMQLDF